MHSPLMFFCHPGWRERPGSASGGIETWIDRTAGILDRYPWDAVLAPMLIMRLNLISPGVFPCSFPKWSFQFSVRFAMQIHKPNL